MRPSQDEPRMRCHAPRAMLVAGPNHASPPMGTWPGLTLPLISSRTSLKEYCDLKRDRGTGRSKGYAYVNYMSPEVHLVVLGLG